MVEWKQVRKEIMNGQRITYTHISMIEYNFTTKVFIVYYYDNRMNRNTFTEYHNMTLSADIYVNDTVKIDGDLLTLTGLSQSEVYVNCIIIGTDVQLVSLQELDY